MPGVPGRVLVVDDNKVIRQLIRVNLELEGFEVVTAADGVECLDIVQQVQPDVITLDVVMPRLDGLRTAARLRADARTRDVPIVVISACTQYEVESGLEVGVDAFLAKPFEPNELVGIVRQLMFGEGDGEEGSGEGGRADPCERDRGALEAAECRASGCGAGGGGVVGGATIGEAERAAQSGG
ncbi:response regulator [Streptomyces sp. NPDC050732]|uniref:response regulator n=1 Tax=Streptomyces sp. NPDC050732 TaxID=3154632 RepID=UPI0034128380